MPDSCAYPTAAGVPDSGTPITRSASTGHSRANRRPISTRVACTDRPASVLSGRARYTYSKTQPLGVGLAKRVDLTPSASIASNSPGSMSRTNEAPTMSSAAVSDATTQPRSSRPSESAPPPIRVTARIQGVFVHERQAEPSAHGRQQLQRGLFQGGIGRAVGQQGAKDVGVRCRRGRAALSDQPRVTGAGGEL